MCSACIADGVEIHEYKITATDIMILFKAPADRIIWSHGRVNDKIIMILDLIADTSSITIADISKALNISGKTAAVKIKLLKEQGIIERIGSDRKGDWKVNRIGMACIEN